MASVALLICLLTGCDNRNFNGDPATEEAFNRVFENAQIFRLQERLPVWEEKLSDHFKLSGSLFLDCYFNRPAASNQKINTFFKDFGDVSEADYDHYLLQVRYANHLKIGEYQQAFATIETILRDFPGANGQEGDDTYRFMQEILAVLGDTPPPTVAYSSPTSLKFVRGQYGFSTLEVPSAEDTLTWVLDFTSDFSMVQRSLAREMDWDVPAPNITVQNFYGEEVGASLVVIDPFLLGGVTYYNLPFIVMEDEDLVVYDEYAMRGILCGSALSRLERITISKAGTFTVEKGKGTRPGEANMAMDHWTPFVLAKYKGDTLKFAPTVDFGEAILFPPFYDQYGEEMEAGIGSGPPSVPHNAPNGSYVKTYSYDMDLEIGGKTLQLRGLDLETPNEWATPLGVHGRLGINELWQFESFTLDYTVPAFIIE